MPRAPIVAIVGLAVGLASLVQARASSPAQQAQQPTFKSGVSLVTLDVTVVDRDGHPVTGLTPDDFAVTLEGQPRPVRVLDYLEFGTSASSASAPSREASNVSAATSARGSRSVLLLLDDLSYPPGATTAKTVTTAAEGFLEQLDVSDVVAVASTSGLAPPVNPTRDRAVVRTALQKMVGRNDDTTAPFYISVPEAIEIERDFVRETLSRVAGRECLETGLSPEVCPDQVRAMARGYARSTLHRVAMQMNAYRTVIEAMKVMPAPRVLILLTRGLPPIVEEGLKSQLDPITQAAAEAGVQFYSLTVPDVGADAGDTTQERAKARREEGAVLNNGAHVVASAAGGEAFNVIGTAKRFFTRIEAETSGLYRLGVEAPLADDAGDAAYLLKAKVKVSRPGVTVRTRPKVLANTPPPEPKTPDELLKTALQEGGTSYGVPIAMATALRRAPGATGPQAALQLGLNVQVPSVIPGPVAMMFGVLDSTGAFVQAGKVPLAQPASGADHVISVPVSIPEGTYRLRISAVDADGNVGSLEQPLAATLATLGPFKVSELFTSWSGSDNTSHFLALERLPDSATILSSSLELYAPNAAALAGDVTVHFALARVIEGADDLSEMDQTLAPYVDGTTLAFTSELSVDGLPPGAYNLTATVRQGEVELGSVRTAIRKM